MPTLDENTLIQLYQTQCDQLFKSMNLELLFHIYTLACNTQNELTLQICATLISNFINLNHQDITQFQMIFDGIFTIIIKTNSINRGTYHLLGSILANIHFYFQDKLPSNKFNQCIQELLLNKTIALFPVIEATIRKLNPNHKLHKKAIITIDSQHRAVKNNFYKNSLELLLDTIMYILMNNLTQYINQAINLFDDILEGEFQTDTKEKDFHKLRRGDIKNDNSLQKQLSKFTLKLIEDEIQLKMIENSTLQWVDPTRSNIKKLWSRIMNLTFIQQLLTLLPSQSNILKVLANICKVLKKHYYQDQKTIEIINYMTQEIQKLSNTNYSIIQLLKFSNRTLFANSSIDWISFNLQQFNRVQKIEELVQVFRFLRQLCRHYRQQKNVNLDEISIYFIQIISNFFIHWITVDNQIFSKDNYAFQNIRYNIKVIACFIYKSYFEFFKQIIAQNQNNIKLINEAFNFLLIGFKSLSYEISYKLDVVMKYRHYQNMDLFLYPFDIDSFYQFNYQQFLAEQIEILWKIQLYLQTNGIQNNRFYYYLWKVFFDKDLLIKFEPIIKQSNVDRTSLFNFSQIVNSIDQEYKEKCLKLIHKSKFKFEKDAHFQTYQCLINEISIPGECFLEFTRFNVNLNTESQEILKAYNGIKCNLYNSQNDAFYNQEECETLKSQFSVELNTIISNLQDINQIMMIFNSLLNENGKFTYKQVMTLMWEQERFTQFNQLLSYCQNIETATQLLSFTKLMINPDIAKSLRSEVVDEIYDWIYNLSKFHVDWLKVNSCHYNQERQTLGENMRTQTYQLYYRPIRKLLKLFVKIKHMGKCLTSKVQTKQKIHGLILDTIHLINLNDLDSLIHKMEPLYRICEWLVESDHYVQKLSSSDSHLILELVDQGIKLQEKMTFTIAIKIFENLKDKPTIQDKHYVLIQFILEDLLIAAYIYNQKVQDIGKLLYNHLRKYPNLFDSLFVSIQQRVIIQKTQLWQQQFIQKASILKQKLSEKHEHFTEAFTQLQMLYNYLQ